MDTFSKSDPILFLFLKQNNVWQKIGQTEVIHDNLSPQWVTKVPVQYNFEKNDQFRLEVYDIDDETQINNIKAHDPLGHLEFTLHEVVTCIDQIMKKQLVNPAKPTIKSYVKIVAEEIQSGAISEIFIFKTNCMLSESSGLYFYIVYKMRAPGQYTPLYKSEVRKSGNNKLIDWNETALGTTDLCNDNVDQEIKIEFFRSETSGSHKNMGHIITTLGVLKS